MECRKCGYEVPTSARDCPACGTDNGYPNVRLGETEAERRALKGRVLQAEESAIAADYKHVLDQFGNAVLESRAVLARSMGVIQDLFEDRNKNYTSYHHHLAAKVRNPADNEFDRVRTQYEAALFPNFYQEIIFASLTLNNKGVRGYGNYFIILKDEMLAHRATVFEENPHLFVQRHKVLLSEPLPPGFRATWDERDKLAKAKLYPKLTSNTQPVDFPSVPVTPIIFFWRGRYGTIYSISLSILPALRRTEWARGKPGLRIT